MTDRRVDGVGVSPQRPGLGAQADRLSASATGDLRRLVELRSQTATGYGGRLGVEAVRLAVLDMIGEHERLTVIAIPSETPGAGEHTLLCLRGSGSGRLLLSGHLDCVGEPPGGLPFCVRDGRAFGRGTYDMKGGVVMTARLLQWLATRPGDFEQVFALLTVDEEARSGRLVVPQPLLRTPVDACLCFEGGSPQTPGGVVVERSGAGVLRCVVRGTAGRAVYPTAGPHALAGGGELLTRLVQVAETYASMGVQVVPTRIHGEPGQSISTVAAEAQIDVVLRWNARAAASQAVAQLIASLPRRVANCAVEYHFEDQYPVMARTERTDAILQMAERELARALPRVVRSEGASDANVLSQGAAASFDGLGPCGAGDHTDDEHVELSSFAPAYEVSLAIILAALARPLDSVSQARDPRVERSTKMAA